MQKKKTTQSAIKRLKKFLDEDPNIFQAILFGSYATGMQHAKSDIDIAIQLADPMSTKQKMMYLEKIYDCTGGDIDLIDLLTVGQPLLAQIMKYGKRLKGSSNQYAELAVKNVNTSQDFLPAVRRMMNARRDRLLHG
jgi:predicted nucleotidyltransferase